MELEARWLMFLCGLLALFLLVEGGVYYVVSEGESVMEWCYDGGAAVVTWSYQVGEMKGSKR